MCVWPLMENLNYLPKDSVKSLDQTFGSRSTGCALGWRDFAMFCYFQKWKHRCRSGIFLWAHFFLKPRGPKKWIFLFEKLGFLPIKKQHFKFKFWKLGSYGNLAQLGECPVFSLKNHSTLLCPPAPPPRCREQWWCWRWGTRPGLWHSHSSWIYYT